MNQSPYLRREGLQAIVSNVEIQQICAVHKHLGWNLLNAETEDNKFDKKCTLKINGTIFCIMYQNSQTPNNLQFLWVTPVNLVVLVHRPVWFITTYNNIQWHNRKLLKHEAAFTHRLSERFSTSSDLASSKPSGTSDKLLCEKSKVVRSSISKRSRGMPDFFRWLWRTLRERRHGRVVKAPYSFSRLLFFNDKCSCLKRKKKC